ncbi:MAG TPA: nitrogen fixation protein FixH [Achromobacter sp.]|uniref:FixH family protein n=1 Tax=Achromobacter sp. TaxID=134375 RepID=UPI000EEC13E3|nr:FixH family protein [Achromobacter sp.]HAP26404.1 nitrogen fixation protein FixH [Achromobacter sp.]
MNAAHITLESADPAHPVKPWYREPWPWILMAGPFAAMVGCFITIYFAMTQFASQPIQEGVVKRGLVIEQTASGTAASRTPPAAGPAAAKP